MSSILEISLPAAEPVPQSTVLQFLKRSASDPDATVLIPLLTRAARRVLERWTGLTLAQRNFVQYQDGFPFFPYFQSPYAPLFGAAFPFYFGYGPVAAYPYPAIGGLQNQMLNPFEVRALKNPVTAITGINYIGSDGLPHSLVPFKDFIPDFAAGRVTPMPGQRWPVSTTGANAVQIYFSAGYAPDGTTTPATLDSAPGWEPNETSLALYAYFFDANDNVEIQTHSPTATTGATEPEFSSVIGATTNESGGATAVWQNNGPVLGAWSPETEYAGGFGIVFDGNGNLQQLIASGENFISGTSIPAWATTVGGVTSDNGVSAWRCLGPYQGTLPSPANQPANYTRTINIPEDIEIAILLMTSHFYYNRDAVAAGPAMAVPLGVNDIVQSIRDLDFGPIGSQ